MRLRLPNDMAIVSPVGMTGPLPPDLPDGFILQEQSDPAEMMIGPFFKHRSRPLTTFRPRPEHTNALGTIHGGILMTFADFTLCSAAIRATGDSDCITVNMNCNFVSGGDAGAWLYGEAEIVRTTGRMVFVDGKLISGNDPVLSFSGIGRRVHEARGE